MMQKLYIKNMVCRRCILAVEDIFSKQAIDIAHIQLGEVVLQKELPDVKLESLREDLKKVGFELLDDQKQQLIERIKTTIVTQVHHSAEAEKHKLSEVLSASLNKDYSYLSNLFSEVEGITIEKFYIQQRIERVKEMLIYDELTLSEIAFKNGFSSVAHLSSQFKKTTGLTPKYFKASGTQQRRAIDKI